MNENLIVEDNTIYEIDPECLKKKREQEARKKSEEKLKNDAEYRKNQDKKMRAALPPQKAALSHDQKPSHY